MTMPDPKAPEALAAVRELEAFVMRAEFKHHEDVVTACDLAAALRAALPEVDHNQPETKPQPNLPE